MNLDLDIISLNEPYFTDNGVACLSHNFNVISSVDKPKVAIVIANNNFKVNIILVKECIIVLSFMIKNIEIIYIAIYCSPSSNLISLRLNLMLVNIIRKAQSLVGILKQNVHYRVDRPWIIEAIY